MGMKIFFFLLGGFLNMKTVPKDTEYAYKCIHIYVCIYTSSRKKGGGSQSLSSSFPRGVGCVALAGHVHMGVFYQEVLGGGVSYGRKVDTRLVSAYLPPPMMLIGRLCGFGLVCFWIRVAP